VTYVFVRVQNITKVFMIDLWHSQLINPTLIHTGEFTTQTQEEVNWWQSSDTVPTCFTTLPILKWDLPVSKPLDSAQHHQIMHHFVKVFKSIYICIYNFLKITINNFWKPCIFYVVQLVCYPFSKREKNHFNNFTVLWLYLFIYLYIEVYIIYIQFDFHNSI